MESWKLYKRKIDQRLDAARPDRVGPNETEWREPVYGWARNHIPDESNLVRRYAEDIVNQREGQATKRGNRILRDWSEGILPLFWDDVGALPIKLNDGTRVRLDAATTEDLDDASRKLRDDGKRTFDKVLTLTDGMDDIARTARRQGRATIAEIGDLDPRENGEVKPFSGERPDQIDIDDSFEDEDDSDDET